MRIRKMLFPLVSSILLVPALLAQTLSYEDHLALRAPTISGETGLFKTIDGDTLSQGDWSFSVYVNNYDFLAAPARDLAPRSARSYRDMGVDQTTLSVSLGYGLTDRWEIVGSIPYTQLHNRGGDRAGFVNGYPYIGRFEDRGLGSIHVGTKIAVLDPATSANHLAFSVFADLPTGDSDSGIATGNPNFGLGLHFDGGGIGVLSGQYKIMGGRDEDNQPGTFGDFDLPNELHLDAGLNIPLRFWSTTNWINEVNAVLYQGGDRKPDNPIYLVTGIRHWFGTSGWALNAAARWNVAQYGDANEHCRFQELDDCALGGLLGLTFAPVHLTPMMAPPPAPVPVPPPPVIETPVEVPPPPVEVAQPAPEVRMEEIHFESGSARLTNIAKAILDDVALRMRDEASSTVMVTGYTDDRESTGANQDLDRRRAEAARDYLVSRHGIDPTRITVEAGGVGSDGDNTTAEGRLRNRRTVIRLTVP